MTSKQITERLTAIITQLKEIADDPISNKFEGEPIECAMESLGAALNDLDLLETDDQ